MTMAEQHDTPALPPLRQAVPPGTSAAPGTGTCAGSVPPAALVPMSRAARAGAAARHGAAASLEAARELWLLPGRLLHVLWHGKPESMAEHRAYMQSRAWVPPGMTGRWEKAVTGAGLAYHLLIARPLKAAAKTVDGAADRPLRLAGLAVFVIALLVLLAVL